jgi:CDP-diacylglycerol--glycerol-3-phosphate 3-phosphatidyltransferase
MNVPNFITVSRVVLAIATLALLYWPANATSPTRDTMLWVSFGLTVLVIWGDGLDGYFARKLKQTSKLGAILDIAGDRAVEMAYWIVFAALGWIAVWVPLLYLVRGTFVDAMRSHASSQGFTAFGDNTMMKSPLGKFLVASNFSRFTYAIVKALAFCLVIAAQTAALKGGWAQPTADLMVYLSAAFCLLRGLPVLFESKTLFKN